MSCYVFTPASLDSECTSRLLLLFNVLCLFIYELLKNYSYHIFSLHLFCPHLLPLFCSFKFQSILLPKSLFFSYKIPFVQLKLSFRMILILQFSSPLKYFSYLGFSQFLQMLRVKFFSVNISTNSIYIALYYVFRRFFFFLFFESVIVLHHQQLSIRTSILINYFFNSFPSYLALLLFENHIKLDRTACLRIQTQINPITFVKFSTLQSCQVKIPLRILLSSLTVPFNWLFDCVASVTHLQVYRFTFFTFGFTSPLCFIPYLFNVLSSCVSNL